MSKTQPVGVVIPAYQVETHLAETVGGIPEFVDHIAVSNGCPDFLVQVFGDKGRHARPAVYWWVLQKFKSDLDKKSPSPRFAGRGLGWGGQRLGIAL